MQGHVVADHFDGFLSLQGCSYSAEESAPMTTFEFQMPAQREDRNAQLAGRALERTGSDNPIHDVGRKREAWV